jgi:predicted AAA+ superfamily ATPase
MKIIDRLLKIDLPPAQSAFLWGPRKTGKTTYGFSIEYLPYY